MRFGLITPVFDGCIDSLELLYRDIAEQTHANWVWVLCGNKFSEKVSSFAKGKQKLDERGRIVYLIANLKDEKNVYSIIANIGKRRDICVKRMNVDYFLMVNADSKFLDKGMLSKVSAKLEEQPKNLCVYKTIFRGEIYPKFPLEKVRDFGGIDSLNFCVSSSTAKKVGYPSNADFRKFNDERFFNRVFKECSGDYCFIDEVFGEFNGNNRYKNISSKVARTMRKGLKFTLLDYIFYCLHDNYLPGLVNVLKEILVQAGFSRKLIFKDES
jgi:hypothetical protein